MTDRIDVPYDAVVHETESAWLLTVEDEDIWFPKSQCSIGTENEEISVPTWLAIEKGLEHWA
jgi:hypothetical protein